MNPATTGCGRSAGEKIRGSAALELALQIQTSLRAGATRRTTRQRCITTQAIADKSTAFTAESLARELRDRGVSRSTVYRVLDLLQAKHAIARVPVGRTGGFVVCG